MEGISKLYYKTKEEFKHKFPTMTLKSDQFKSFWIVVSKVFYFKANSMNSLIKFSICYLTMNTMAFKILMMILYIQLSSKN